MSNTRWPGPVWAGLSQSYLDAHKVCIACSRCTQIMRDGGKTGCVIRDAYVYLPIYKAGRASKSSQ